MEEDLDATRRTVRPEVDDETRRTRARTTTPAGRRPTAPPAPRETAPTGPAKAAAQELGISDRRTAFGVLVLAVLWMGYWLGISDYLL